VPRRLPTVARVVLVALAMGASMLMPSYTYLDVVINANIDRNIARPTDASDEAVPRYFGHLRIFIARHESSTSAVAGLRVMSNSANIKTFSALCQVRKWLMPLSLAKLCAELPGEESLAVWCKTCL
jgi:hypothetical protein